MIGRQEIGRPIVMGVVNQRTGTEIAGLILEKGIAAHRMLLNLPIDPGRTVHIQVSAILFFRQQPFEFAICLTDRTNDHFPAKRRIKRFIIFNDQLSSGEISHGKGTVIINIGRSKSSGDFTVIIVVNKKRCPIRYDQLLKEDLQ